MRNHDVVTNKIAARAWFQATRRANGPVSRKQHDEVVEELERRLEGCRVQLEAAEERAMAAEEKLEVLVAWLTPQSVNHRPDALQVQCLETWYAAGSGSIPVSKQILHAVLGLAGEAGEVADLLKKWAFKPGSTIGREDVLDELADVVYYAAVLADLWGFNFWDMKAHLAEKLADGHGWKGTPPIADGREQ